MFILQLLTFSFEETNSLYLILQIQLNIYPCKIIEIAKLRLDIHAGANKRS